LTLVTAGRVGKPHGRDGSFYVEGPRHPLPEGGLLEVDGHDRRIVRRAGTEERPLIRLEGIDDPRPLRGVVLLVEDELAEDEWLASDLLGCSVPGMGRVSQIVDGPSCSVLELEDGTLIPLVGDAIERIDLDAREIHVNREFLG
jgi:16S rRNA processing protein RimM